MTAKRTIRTQAQRLADAKKEADKIEQQIKDRAINLRKQAAGWDKRADELLAKADSARELADNLLESIGFDPETFWIAHSNEIGLDPAATKQG